MSVTFILHSLMRFVSRSTPPTSSGWVTTIDKHNNIKTFKIRSLINCYMETQNQCYFDLLLFHSHMQIIARNYWTVIRREYWCVNLFFSLENMGLFSPLTTLEIKTFPLVAVTSAENTDTLHEQCSNN